MLWPPNAWKNGGRQKLLPHVRKASDAQVLAEFLSNGLHEELGLGSSGLWEKYNMHIWVPIYYNNDNK